MAGIPTAARETGRITASSCFSAASSWTEFPPLALALAAAALSALAGCASVPATLAARDRVAHDLIYADAIRGGQASALHCRIFGAEFLDGKRYRDFFERRVSRVDGEGILFASCHGAIACAQGDRVRISPDYTSLEIPAPIRLSILIHEARHLEPGGWKHSNCPSPFLDGEGRELRSPYQGRAVGGAEACDVEALGAYGIQIVMLRNVARHCRTCVAADRRSADAFADFLMNLVRSPEARAALAADAASDRVED